MDLLWAVLGYEGLPLLIGAVLIAGIVRGFTGFGTALVYIPLASIVLPPVWALTTMMIFDLFGPLPLVPRALRDAELPDVLRLLVGAFIGLVIGLYVLTKLDPVIFRWAICITAMVLLGTLVSGWRYVGNLSNPVKIVTGFVSGIFGGLVGAGGPPVILFYLGGSGKVASIRANIMLYLLGLNILLLTVLGVRGLLEITPLLIGVVLTVPYTLGGLLGQAFFDPAKEKIYRQTAYVVIAAAAVSGMPVFS